MKNNSNEVNFCLCARADCELSEGGESRAMTKDEEARERPLQYARRFGAFFACEMEKDKGITTISMLATD